MKCIFIILSLIFSTNLFAQDFKTIDSFPELKQIFYDVTGQTPLRYINVKNVFTNQKEKIKIDRDNICIDSFCSEITSPVYFYRRPYSNPDEISFSFRLSRGRVCILFTYKDELELIEIFDPIHKEFIQYTIITPEQ